MYYSNDNLLPRQQKVFFLIRLSLYGILYNCASEIRYSPSYPLEILYIIPVKAFIVDLGQQHVILIHAGITSQDLPEFPHIGRLIHAHANLDLSWLLRRVENIYIEIHLAMILRHWHRHAQERVEGV